MVRGKQRRPSDDADGCMMSTTSIVLDTMVDVFLQRRCDSDRVNAYTKTYVNLQKPDVGATSRLSPAFDAEQKILMNDQRSRESLRITSLRRTLSPMTLHQQPCSCIPDPFLALLRC
jgi:hypothetical protein